MSQLRITIVGLGLIGGSIAKALRAKGEDVSIAALDREYVLESARSLLDESAPVGSPKAEALVASADLVVLASPTRAILESIAPTLDLIREGAVVTDTASIKLGVAERAAAHPRGSRFVAGHPMAGREIGGFEASRAELFDGASWFLVEEGADADAKERVRAFVSTLGAKPRTTNAGEHDRAMAVVSHAPHLVASALLELGAQAGALDYAGPGFRDTTRIAGGPDNVWADIFAENREYIAAALDALVLRLDAIKTALKAGESEGVRAALDLLEGARRARREG